LTEFTFVVNPTAGKGSGRKAIARLERLLEVSDLSYEVIPTRCPGHATEIARNSGSDIVVAVGGDGTVNEVANGLVGSQKALGIIPIGSGNDFVKSVRISRKLSESLDLLKRKVIHRIDIGLVSCATTENGSTAYAPARYFVNGIGTGFDAAVAQRVSEIGSLKGTLLYLVAVLQTLGVYEAPHFEVSLDGAIQSGKFLLIATGNGKCAGGGFYLTPEASVDDGLLDVCLIREVPIPRILRLIPAVMSGKRVSDTSVGYGRVSSIEITSAQRFYVHADGEVIGKGVNGVRIQIVPKALAVVAGDGPS
jgi:diacylglycerol kinase (ATP)